ncbi:hypothetical protein GA0070563_101393 [Micromonospora carbonacea]|uniref:Uncharacterized protein n=1 Tax=Micromonospora carbonacea TaxID=47853 RepID=A0A1C4UBJ9_9ACTN|nr:hypothetical protein GA0070563_101393 [Micromonospora carbonacea]
MSEAGQPGAATPGEHGDGTGQQDDLARSVSGWAPSATGWSGGGDAGASREASSGWGRAEPASGWGASSPRHGDLPAPLPGPATRGEPATRVNGHPHVNGVSHPGDESRPGRPTPVSAPPHAEGAGWEADDDRLAVPAQRPASALERSAPARGGDPDPAARHSSDDQPVSRLGHWPDDDAPASAPPAGQAPPVDPGFDAARGFPADRAAPDHGATAGGPYDWAHRFPPEDDDPRGYPAAESGRGGHPGEPGRGGYPGEPDRGPDRGRDETAAPPPPGWAGPDWNRPSWGGGWAPPWSRDQGEPVARRLRDDEGEPTRRSRDDGPAGRRLRADEDTADRRAGVDELAGRRARAEAEPNGPARPEAEQAGPPSREGRAADWAPPAGRGHPPEPVHPYAAEPTRPYEPVRAEPVRPYQPVRAEPVRPHEVPRPGSEPRAGSEPATRPAPEPAERPAWAGAHPASAPPAGGPGTSSAAAVDPAEVRAAAARPFRLRPVPEDAPPTDAPGRPPTATGAGPTAVPATSGIGRLVRTPPAPAPASAPPYAARRSAPDPVNPAAPADGGRQPDRTAVLPQRVPAEPDVPVVPEPPAVEPPAETPELARIATHLRRDDEPAPPQERPEGFDVNAILDAVRGVAGVRDAALRRTPAGAHSLRLDLADGADPAEVSRQVARLLQDRMGLAAAPQDAAGPPGAPPPPVRRRSAEARPDLRGTAPRPPERRPADPRAVDPRAAGRLPEGRPSADAPPPRLDRRADPAGEPPRRRRQATTHRGRAAVEEPGQVSAAPAGLATGSPATLGSSYSGGQMTTTETAPSRPLDTGGAPGPRVVIDHVQVSTFGLDANVEVRLLADRETASGYATGPAVDGYVLRLCAVAAAAAVDQLLRGGEQEPDRGRCFVEHAAVVPFGNCEVATVVVLLVCDGWVEQLAGSALVAGDPRQAVVRATLAAVNRRLEALLA